MASDFSKHISEKAEELTLEQAYTGWSGSESTDIPFLVWLLENPDSILALPGKIYLREHDYLHIILGRSQSVADEAFVIGFTMGSEPKTNQFHTLVFKFVARYFYPKLYRFSAKDLKIFDWGFTCGRQSKFNLTKVDFRQFQEHTVITLR